jgi:hypothetical protein
VYADVLINSVGISITKDIVSVILTHIDELMYMEEHITEVIAKTHNHISVELLSGLTPVINGLSDDLIKSLYHIRETKRLVNLMPNYIVIEI